MTIIDMAQKQYKCIVGGTEYMIELEPDRIYGVKAIVSMKRAGYSDWIIIGVKCFMFIFGRFIETQWKRAHKWAAKEIALIEKYGVSSKERVQ